MKQEIVAWVAKCPIGKSKTQYSQRDISEFTAARMEKGYGNNGLRYWSYQKQLAVKITVLVVMDRLTKSAHFLVIRKTN